MKKILCYGDSNTWGYDPRKTTPEVMARYEDTVRWTGRLEMELGKDYRVIEAGYCGRTTVFDDPLVSHCNGFSFLEPVFYASYPIDWCVIMLGTNDTKTHFHASAAVIARGMERIVHEFYRLCETIHSNSTKLLLMSPPYLTRAKTGQYSDPCCNEESEEKARALAEYYRNIAARNHCFFMDAAQYAQPSGIDGMHLGEDGHAQLGKAIAQFILQEDRI